MQSDLTREDVERITEKLHRSKLIHSCMTCVHFSEQGGHHRSCFMDGDVKDYPNTPPETCTLYGVRPPARVIAYGCPSWEEGLPF